MWYQCSFFITKKQVFLCIFLKMPTNALWKICTLVFKYCDYAKTNLSQITFIRWFENSPPLPNYTKLMISGFPTNIQDWWSDIKNKTKKQALIVILINSKLKLFSSSFDVNRRRNFLCEIDIASFFNSFLTLHYTTLFKQIILF